MVASLTYYLYGEWATAARRGRHSDGISECDGGLAVSNWPRGSALQMSRQPASEEQLVRRTGAAEVRAAHLVWGGGVREATKTPPSHGRIAEFFALFRVHEPRRQSQCHGDSIRRRWHYFEFSTPATIQMGPRRPPEHRHHRPPPPPLRSLPMAPLPRPGVCARSQAAPGDLNAHLGILSCRRRSTETRNLEKSRPPEYYVPRFDWRWLGRAWLRAQVPCGRSGAIGSHLNTRGEHRHYPAAGAEIRDFHQNRHRRHELRVVDV